jgi:hypothetical protein
MVQDPTPFAQETPLPSNFLTGVPIELRLATGFQQTQTPGHVGVKGAARPILNTTYF